MTVIIFLEKALSMIFWVLIIFGFDSVSVAILTLVCAVIHELGHIAVLSALNKKGGRLPYGRLNGLRISVRSLSYTEEIAVALGGPAVNIAAALLAFMFSEAPGFGEYLTVFAFINLMTMISNLLPICGYDGYKALEAAVMLLSHNPMGAKRILTSLSFFFCILICFISLYFMLKIGEGYWIFAVFLSTVISETAKKAS